MRRPLRTSSAAITALLLLLCAVLPGASAAPMKHAKREARQQIAALEEQWRAATVSGDFAQLDRMLSDDYVGISWTGQVNTKESQIDRIRTHSLALTKIAFEDVKVKVLHGVAIVTCRAQVIGTSAGARMDGMYRYTRVYQRMAGGQWQITNFEATRVPGGSMQGLNAHNTSQP